MSRENEERGRCYRIAKQVENQARFYGNADMATAAATIASRIKRGTEGPPRVPPIARDFLVGGEPRSKLVEVDNPTASYDLKEQQP